MIGTRIHFFFEARFPILEYPRREEFFELQFRNIVLRLLDHEILWINLFLIRRMLHRRQCSDKYRMWDGFTFRFPSWFISSRNGSLRAWLTGNPVFAFGLPAHTPVKKIAVGSSGMVGSTKTSLGKLHKFRVSKCRLELRRAFFKEL